jgi:hypothetical protein
VILVDANLLIREWLAVENVWIPSPHEHHAEIFGTLISHGATSQLIPDAHLGTRASTTKRNEPHPRLATGRSHQRKAS